MHRNRGRNGRVEVGASPLLAPPLTGIDLLPSGNNAIGGFYGPFFTPENGLINPPEHTNVEIDVVERGPVLHHYRMSGTIPDGLLDELEGQALHDRLEFFTHGPPWFQPPLRVDDFRTVINGRSPHEQDHRRR